jgi:hypothetical protein
MGSPVANDGVGWNWMDNLTLWVLPMFLAWVGLTIGGDGWKSWVAFAAGMIGGIAVVRGIQVAINGHRPDKGQAYEDNA